MKNWEVNQIDDEDAFKALFVGEETPVVETPAVEAVVEKTEGINGNIEVPEVVEEKPLTTEQDFLEQFGEDSGEQGEEKKAETEKSTGPKTIDAAFLKATATYKAEKYGIDLGEEDIEWDEEAIAALEDQIDEIRLEEKYNTLKDSREDIKALFNVAENDGDITDLLGLLGKKQELTQIDTSTLDGKIEKIRKYYKEIDGKPPVWIDKHIGRLQVSDDTADLEEEFKLIDEQYNKYFAAQTEQKVKEAEQSRILKERKQQKEITDFNGALKEKKFTDKEAQEMTDFVFNDQKWKMKNSNQTLSDFDYAIMKAKNNAAQLADLTLFLKDKELYDKKLINTFKNVTNEGKFKSILEKTTASISTANSAVAQTENKKTKFKFPEKI